VQQPEVGNATRIGDDGFAIQDEVLRGQHRERIGDRLKAQRPIVTTPCVDGRLSVSEVRLRAVAVELNLVDPVPARRAFWRSVGWQGSMNPGNGAGLAPGTTLGSIR
jgi:hypothetical protein